MKREATCKGWQTIGDGWRVSTIRGGLGRPERPFETMIFGTLWDCRYGCDATEKEALVRHDDAVWHCRRAWFRRLIVRICGRLLIWAQRPPVKLGFR